MIQSNRGAHYSQKNKTELILTDIPKQSLGTLAHANIKPIKGALRFYLMLSEARGQVIQHTDSK